MRVTRLFTVLLSILLLTLIWISPAQGQIRTLKEKVRSGHTLFHMYRCVNCHTVLGKGGDVGPDLSRITVWASPILGAAVMWNHVPVMSKAMKEREFPWPKFKGEEIGDIFTYLNSLNKHKPKGAMYAYRGEAHIGKELFAGIGCQACHGKPFSGGSIGPDLGQIVWRLKNENEFATRMLRHAPHMIEVAKKAGLIWPNLTGIEIANIYAYLRTLVQTRSLEPGKSN